MELSLEKIIAGFSNVVGCERCSLNDVHRDTFFNLPQPGFIGKNYAKHRLVLIGQNPGASPERFADKDKLYADLLLKLRKEQSSAAYSTLYAFLLDFMEKWQVTKYFPIDECNLGLEDIAYFNLVRCRTRNNAAPSRNVTQSCMQHSLNWIEMLSPRVVVCIGKHSYDRISYELEKRGIPCCFTNRIRSLDNSARQIDRNNAATFVNNILGSPNVKTIKKEFKQMSEVEATKTVVPGITVTHCQLIKLPKTSSLQVTNKALVVKSNEQFSSLGESMFRQILKKLGFIGDVAVTKVLKHRDPVPSIYFNSNREHKIFFTAKESDLSRFHPSLWIRAEGRMQIKNKDLEDGKINLVPKLGKEEEAFKSLLGK